MSLLTELEFPVFPLRAYERIFKASKGAVFVKDKVGDLWMLDDTSIPGNFLHRRLKLKFQLKDISTVKLYKLSKSYYSWSELLHMHKRNVSKTYIDCNGRVFKYIPKEYVKVSYHRIRKIIVSGDNNFIALDGISSWIKVYRLPEEEYKYAGVLHSPIGMVFFGYSIDKLKDTVRKV